MHSRKHPYSTLIHRDSLAEDGIIFLQNFGGIAAYLLDSFVATKEFKTLLTAALLGLTNFVSLWMLLRSYICL